MDNLQHKWRIYETIGTFLILLSIVISSFFIFNLPDALTFLTAVAILVVCKLRFFDEMCRITIKRYEEDLLVLGSKVGIKFLNKVKSWNEIKVLLNNANKRLWKLTEKTEYFEKMEDDEATRCC